MIERQERALVRRRTDGALLELREEKAQAERANHEKSRFLAVASHDLRQPIHALGLYIDELRRKILDQEQQQLLGKVEHSIDSITRLINALLDISRLDAGVVSAQKQPCHLSELLERIAAGFQQEAACRNIRLVVHPIEGYVNSDPVLLERIITNLLSNALRYTPEHGTVLLACRLRGRQILLEIRDNGIGIEKVFQSKIFREFIQLNQNTEQGLGLGLAIVKRLADLLGHPLMLRSARNRGANFSMLLERASRPEQAGLAEPAPGHLNGMRLLIVDHDAQMLASTGMMLKAWGCEVTAASSLKAVQRHLMAGLRWDLVISDDQGKGAGRLNVIQTVRRYQGESTPCIRISTDSLAQDEDALVLLKPVKPAKLRSLIQFCCSRHEQPLAKSRPLVVPLSEVRPVAPCLMKGRD
ncbi:MAG TPA: hypothetical protein DE312_04435 [Gallionella sp.]|nr:hybrid sensor histidine kinase/response regulator [Gallionella sp.]OGS67699.1 MAG: hypothetical protein A2Z87_06050 [Gallionellales bacterium GWA2_54_124]HCI52551.1 hypothetical protein [Gallionella sp.]